MAFTNWSSEQWDACDKAAADLLPSVMGEVEAWQKVTAQAAAILTGVIGFDVTPGQAAKSLVRAYGRTHVIAPKSVASLIRTRAYVSASPVEQARMLSELAAVMAAGASADVPADGKNSADRAREAAKARHVTAK
jgi:hypothetical protein